MGKLVCFVEQLVFFYKNIFCMNSSYFLWEHRILGDERTELEMSRIRNECCVCLWKIRCCFAEIEPPEGAVHRQTMYTQTMTLCLLAPGWSHGQANHAFYK